MPVPDSASRYYRRQERLRYTALAAVLAAWRRMQPGAKWEEQYREDVGPKVLALVAASQVATTTEANAYIPAVIAELGLESSGPSVPRVAFVGLAGDGRPVDSLLEQSVAVAGRAFSRLRDEADAPLAVSGSLRVIPATPAFDPEAAAREALLTAEQWITMVAGTILSDTARAAESANTAARPQVDGYVRMLNPPSCSRCAILAGKFYRWDDGFLRHPRCDCRHIPSSESIAGDLTTSADAYFNSLGPAEQDRIFTNRGAEAIRDGADPSQVVNARRDMYRATEFGKNNNGIYGAVARSDSGLLYSTEGATTRGKGFRALNERFIDPNGPVKTRIAGGTRYSRATTVRLMPESIYQIAKDRDDAIRLLRLNGFIL